MPTYPGGDQPGNRFFETNREIVSFRLCICAQLDVRSEWITQMILYETILSQVKFVHFYRALEPWNLLHLTMIMTGRRTAGWLGLSFAGSSAVHSNQLPYKPARRQAWNADQQVMSTFPTLPALGSFSRVKCESVTSGNRFKLGGKLIPKALAIDSERTYPWGEPPNLAELVKPIYAHDHLQQGPRHTLDPQIHATFFDALTLYFNEENVRTKVELEIQALNSGGHGSNLSISPRLWDSWRGQSTKSARLVEWLANKADRLQDPKFGLTNALADADRETLDVEMSREQAMILLANAMLMRIDGERNPVWHSLDRSKFPLSGAHALSAYRKGFNMEMLMSSWPHDDPEYHHRKKFDEASLHKATLLVHGFEQFRQLEAIGTDEAMQYIQQTLSYQSAVFTSLKLDTMISADKKRDFGGRVFDQNDFFNHVFSMDSEEMKDVGGVLPNCKVNFANINNLIGAICRSASAECTVQVTMMEMLISMLFKGMLQSGETVVTAGVARTTSKTTGLHMGFRTHVNHDNDTTDGQRTSGLLPNSKSLEPTMAARVTPKDAQTWFFAHPIVISAPATEIGARMQDAEGLSIVSAKTASEFVEGFREQRKEDFQRLYGGIWQAKVMLKRQYQDYYGTVDGVPQLVVSSGKWGGGAFNNNVVFKAVQQFVIASILDVKLYHSTFGMNDQLATLDKLKALLTKGDVRTILEDTSLPDELGAVRVWPLYELITGDTEDKQTLKDLHELDRIAGDIFMDRKKRVAALGVRDSPDFDDHEMMVRAIAGIMVRNKGRYFSKP